MNRLNLKDVGLSWGLFLAAIYVACVVFDLLFPRLAMYGVWQRLLPGFSWLTPGSFVLGLVEAFVYGVFFAIVCVPIHNYAGRAFAGKTAA